MNRKAVIFAVLLLLLLAPVAAAWSWNPATWISRAFKIGDAKDINLNQQAIGNGFLWNITCGGNCTGFDHTPTVNTTGYDLTNASNLTHGGFDIAGTGDITHTTGAGTRLMWKPASNAFRAGSVTSTAWDSIGANSIGLGYNAEASGTKTISIGSNTISNGTNTLALGDSTISNGIYSTTMGYSTRASSTAATAIGSTTLASGAYSLATGFSTTASGLSSTAMGNNAIAAGAYSVAIGLSDAAHPAIAANTLGISGGTINLTDSGKGITLHSTSGYSHCITVADNGTLQVAANTTCT